MTSLAKFACIFSALLLLMGTSACSPNPKKKCNTCPKWTSELPASPECELPYYQA